MSKKPAVKTSSDSKSRSVLDLIWVVYDPAAWFAPYAYVFTFVFFVVVLGGGYFALQAIRSENAVILKPVPPSVVSVEEPSFEYVSPLGDVGVDFGFNPTFNTGVELVDPKVIQVVSLLGPNDLDPAQFGDLARQYQMGVAKAWSGGFATPAENSQKLYEFGDLLWKLASTDSSIVPVYNETVWVFQDSISDLTPRTAPLAVNSIWALYALHQLSFDDATSFVDRVLVRAQQLDELEKAQAVLSVPPAVSDSAAPSLPAESPSGSAGTAPLMDNSKGAGASGQKTSDTHDPLIRPFGSLSAGSINTSKLVGGLSFASVVWSFQAFVNQMPQDQLDVVYTIDGLLEYDLGDLPLSNVLSVKELVLVSCSGMTIPNPAEQTWEWVRHTPAYPGEGGNIIYSYHVKAPEFWLGEQQCGDGTNGRWFRMISIWPRFMSFPAVGDSMRLTNLYRMITGQ